MIATGGIDLSAWAAATDPRRDLIRLVLLDVDGCLTDGEGSSLDLRTFELIAALNRRAMEEPDLPAVTLCTGRPQPYVELICQAIGGFLPAIFETGAGIYLANEFRYLPHPRLTSDRLETLVEIRRVVQERIIGTGLGFQQIGKEYSITCYPSDQLTLDELYERLAAPLEPYATHYQVHRLRTCVEVLPNDISKGDGARWIAELLELPLERMAGVGDQTADLSYLSIVGAAAVPSNATDDLRSMAHFVASNPSSRGVVDILNWIVARNRALSHDGP